MEHSVAPSGTTEILDTKASSHEFLLWSQIALCGDPGEQLGVLAEIDVAYTHLVIVRRW